MCGIFGWAGKKPQDFNKHKLDILGIWNETRGKHSCGITVDGDISIGVNGTKVYRDFLAGINYDVPTKIPSVIGHTRHATVGSHTVANAHPFGFGGNKHNDGFGFVGVHNGSLTNADDLADEFDIKKQVTKSVKEGETTTRSKIDSEILLEALFKTGNFKVLSKYNGAAALIFTDLNHPDVVYFYHGKSKLYSYSKDPTEERPLFYYQESKNSVYVSSIEDSLLAIGGDADTVGMFEHNVVYKVTNGNIASAEKFNISRVNNCQKESQYTPKKSTSEGTNSSVGKQSRIQLPAGRVKGHESGNAIVKNNIKMTEPNIYLEKPIGGQNSHGPKLVYNQLRYSRNGHPVTGCFTYIRDFGFYHLAFSPRKAEERFWALVNKKFYNGDFEIESAPFKESQGFVPFLHEAGKKEITKPPICYIFNGIMIDTPHDYNAAIDMDKANRPFNWFQLAVCSKYPVIDWEVVARPDSSQGAFLHGEPYTGSFHPLGGDKVYTFRDGNCVKIVETEESKARRKADEEEKESEKIIESAENVLKDLEKAELSETAQRAEDFSKLTGILESAFMPMLESMADTRSLLKQFDDFTIARNAIAIISDFEESVLDLAILEEKMSKSFQNN